MAKEYIRRWRLRSDSQGLQSPNVPDELWVAPPPPPPPPPTAVRKAILTRATVSSQWTVTPPTGGGSDDFVLRTSEPVVIGDPKFPSAGTNVGVTGEYTQTLVGDRTITSGTYKNTRFQGFVSASGGTFENCLFEAGIAPTSKSGYFTVTGGTVNLIRCTIMPAAPGNVRYWVNSLKANAGTVNTLRCHILLGVDGFRSGGGLFNDQGSLVDRLAFVYPDYDHGPGNEHGSPTYWVHPDCVQITKGGKHTFIGTSFKGFCDATGMSWSGGSWGVGTATATALTYGQPEVALNPNVDNSGYKRTSQPNQLLWSNCITQSGSGSLDLTLEDCWLDGATWGSSIVQLTVGSGHRVRLRRNKIRLGGWPSSSGKYGLFKWPSSTTLDVLNSGADASAKFDNHSSVPVDLRGDIINIGATGASVTV